MPRYPASTTLDATRRAADLDVLAGGGVDVLVVGGGVTGTGVALDAASRGLSVALLERGDLAEGTSRWSSKLVHGGLRYLASGDVALARECAVERGILMTRTAPHLVRALPLVLPRCRPASRRDATRTFAGLWAGDALRLAAGTPRAVLPGPRRLGAVETLSLAPALAPASVAGGMLTWDGQLTDDVRLVVAIARTAAGFGARILTRCEVTAAGDGRVTATDLRTGTVLEIRAHAVVNATGVWAGQLSPDLVMRPSRGTHLVVPVSRLAGLPAGLSIPMPGEANRYAIVLPAADGRAYLGLTDVPVDALPDGDPVPSDAEIDGLLAAVAPVLREPLTRADVLGAFAGIRPLLHHVDGPTADLSRHHLVHVGRNRVVTVAGGKLTTYRKMAEDAVDAAVRAAHLSAGPCRTRRLGLVGAAPRERLARVAAPPRLVARYGTEAPRVAASAVGEHVIPGCAVTFAELVFGARHEGALDPADLLDRRTRIGLVAADRSAAEAAAERAMEHARATC